jgi:hypothetical protein
MDAMVDSLFVEMTALRRRLSDITGDFIHFNAIRVDIVPHLFAEVDIMKKIILAQNAVIDSFHKRLNAVEDKTALVERRMSLSVNVENLNDNSSFSSSGTVGNDSSDTKPPELNHDVIFVEQASRQFPSE